MLAALTPLLSVYNVHAMSVTRLRTRTYRRLGDFLESRIRHQHLCRLRDGRRVPKRALMVTIKNAYGRLIRRCVRMPLLFDLRAGER